MIGAGIRAGVRRLFRLPLRTSESVRADTDEELQAFVDARVEHLMARGMSPEEARTEALGRLGGTVAETRERLRRSAQQREKRIQLSERIHDVARDVRYAARGLRREALFTAFVIATLALGIGANAAMFGVIDRLLLRGPDHVREPHRVTRVYSTQQTRSGVLETTSILGYITYATLNQYGRSFDGVAAYRVNDGPMGRGITAQKVSVGIASASFFPVLGVRPALGRFFTEAEDAPANAQLVAVLGYQLWQRQFGGDADALGRTIILGDETYVVIGVAPKGFTGVELGTVDVWTPISLMGRRMGRDWTTSWSWTALRVIARLKNGIDREQASAEATSIHQNVYTGGEKSAAEARMTVAPLSFNVQGRETPEVSISRWLVGVAVIVLLVACANIVNLLLARAMRRRREVAVRLALGAGRSRLVGLLLTEGMLLAVVGGAAGLLITYGLGALVRQVLLPGIEWTSSPVDGRVLAASSIIALMTGLLVGLLPALQASNPDLTRALKSTGRTASSAGKRMRAALMVTQAALSVVLLIGAGLFVRSVRNISALDLGVEPDRALAVMLNLPQTAADTSSEAKTRWLARRASFYARVLSRVGRLPGVEHASLAVGLPFRSFYGVSLYIPGRDSLPALSGGNPRLQAVSSDYFATVRTPILRGRQFTSSDRRDAERVVILSERVARAYWPGGDALGHCLIIWKKTEPCARVVGIAANTHTREINEEPGLQYYVPYEQAPFDLPASLVVRPSGNSSAIVGTLRRAILEEDSTLAYLDIQTLQQAVDPQIRPWRLGAILFSLMGVLALLVASVGLYSVVSYLVMQRTHEIGVRIALGAGGASIVGLVLRHSVALAGVGVTLGIVLALVAGPLVQPLLFRTEANDWKVIGVVALTLLAVAIIAGVLPALRARRVNPVTALGYD